MGMKPRPQHNEDNRKYVVRYSPRDWPQGLGLCTPTIDSSLYDSEEQAHDYRRQLEKENFAALVIRLKPR